MIDQTSGELNWEQTRTENKQWASFGDDWINQQIPDSWGGMPDVSLNDDTVDDILWRQETVRQHEDLRRETQEQLSNNQAE